MEKRQEDSVDLLKGREGPFPNAAAPTDGGVSRRRLMTVGGALALGGLAAAGEAVQPVLASNNPSSNAKDSFALDLSSIPNFSAHEHWGSIASIGTAPEGYRCDTESGATPKRRTGLLDLILDPYFSSGLKGVGANPAALSRRANAGSDPVEAMKAVRSLLPQFAMTGTYQCTRRGMLMLHGFDVQRDDPDTITRLDASIAERYQRMFEWYVEAMKRANFAALIRPVHPEYYVRQQSADTAAAEARFCQTILRIDPLLDLWRKASPRRDGLAGIAGIEPTDAKSWRHFIGTLFDLAAQHRTTGIKQLQAYSRCLAFQPVADNDVHWRGELNAEKVRVFQDWVMHECCKQAHDRGWPHQIHVGTHNLSQSSPLPLADMAARLSADENRATPLLAVPQGGRLAGQVPREHLHRHLLAAGPQPSLLPRSHGELAELRPRVQDHVLARFHVGRDGRRVVSFHAGDPCRHSFDARQSSGTYRERLARDCHGHAARQCCCRL